MLRPINASAAVTDVTCNGGANGAVNLTVTGGTAPYTFSWSNGATTEDIRALVAGTYTVTITDAGSPTATFTATVAQPAALNAATNVTNASSPSASDGAVNLSVSGGTAPYTFVWSNSATTEDISGLAAGTYTVTILPDANGCTATATATVSANTSPINASAAVTDVTCNGDANGAVNLTVSGGTAPYTFSWSNGATTEDISGLPAGTYTVTITDAAALTATFTATVAQPAALNASTNVTNASSPSASDGAVNLSVSGGTAPYTFVWSNGATTEDISGLAAGTYTVTITDANGCTATATATVSANASPINASAAVTDVTCNGDSNGAVNLTVSGGTAPYTFSWSNGATTEDISGLAAGSYSVTITDAAALTATFTATVAQPAALNASTNVTNASSPSASDGAVNLSVSGGTAPYTFSWSNGATTEDISGLAAGTYTVTITDANGCTATATATVTANTSASLSITKTVSQTIISAPTTLNYTITIRNTGSAGLTGITVSDPFAGGAAYSSGDTDGDNVLDLAETWIYTADYNATQSDIDAGNDLINTARVTATQVPTPETAQAVTSISATPSLTVSKTVDQTTISAPTTLRYTIRVRNNGTAALTGVSVSDPLTGGATYTSGDADGDNVLDPGETWTYSATYNVTQAMINAGNNIVNTARVTAIQVPTPETAQAVTTIINLSPELTISKSANLGSYSSVGTVIRYSINMTNTGSATLTSISVADPLTGFSQNIASLAPGENVTLNTNYSITQADINRGYLNNTVTARYNYGGIPYSESDNLSIPADVRASMRITKTARETDFTSAGDIINYTFTVTNNGNVTITGISVADPNAGINCPGVPATLAPNASLTCTAVHTVTSADVSAGRITNVATATGYDPGNNQVRASSNEVTVSLNNLAPVITCPQPIVAGTSPTTCDILINSGLNAAFSDPNNNVESLRWTMSGASVTSSPNTGINNLTNHTFNLGITTVTYTVTDAFGLSATCSFTVTVNDNTSTDCCLQEYICLS